VVHVRLPVRQPLDDVPASPRRESPLRGRVEGGVSKPAGAGGARTRGGSRAPRAGEPRRPALHAHLTEDVLPVEPRRTVNLPEDVHFGHRVPIRVLNRTKPPPLPGRAYRIRIAHKIRLPRGIIGLPTRVSGV